MHNLLEITESADKLEDLVYGEPDAQIQRRCHMLLLLKTGEVENRSAAARRLGVHRNTMPAGSGSTKKHEVVASLTEYKYLLDAATA